MGSAANGPRTSAGAGIVNIAFLWLLLGPWVTAGLLWLAQGWLNPDSMSFLIAGLAWGCSMLLALAVAVVGGLLSFNRQGRRRWPISVASLALVLLYTAVFLGKVRFG